MRAITRRKLIMAGAAGAFLPMLPCGSLGFAQTVGQLSLLVPGNPGSGWDQLAQVMEQVLKADKLIGSAKISHMGGAGGTVALPRFIREWMGRPNALLVSGMVMVGASIFHKSSARLIQTIPLARLVGEFEVVVVPASSRFKTLQDFADAFTADPGKVPIAGGSAGGTAHILAAMIAKALNVDPKKLVYADYPGGWPVLAAVLGAKAAAGIDGYWEFAEQIRAGRMRALGISSGTRLPTIDIPTLKEQGIDVELFNWRGVFAPPGITDDQKAAMAGLVEKMVVSRRWTEEVQRRAWISMPLYGEAFETFVADEAVRVEALLKDLGLAN
jgi:putative tricarboxylic transport membrane protein